MIKRIGVENFRIFKEYTEFELAPFTVLTGPNNSGKSSFLKLLDLLQANFGLSENLSKLKFDIGFHNLASFDKVINWTSKSDQLCIEIDFPLDFFDENFKLELIYGLKNEDGEMQSFKIYNENRILVSLSEFKKYEDNYELSFSMQIDLKYITSTINHFTVCQNQENYSKEVIDAFNSYMNKFFFKEGETPNKIHHFERASKLLLEESRGIKRDGKKLPYHLNEFVKINFPKEYNNLESSTSEFFYSPFDKAEFGDFFDKFTDEYFSNKVDQVIFDIGEFDNYLTELFGQSKLSLHMVANSFGSYLEGQDLINEGTDLASSSLNKAKEFEIYFLNNISKGLKKVNFAFRNFNHISAARGSRKRVLDSSSTNDIDGIVREFSQIEQTDDEIDFLNKSLNLLGIQGQIEIERKEGVSFFYIKDSKQKISLSDLGYGYSQVIPILLKILLINKKMNWNNNVFQPINLLYGMSMSKEINKNLVYPTLVIEEPEANLHPNLQSKLADVLALSYKTFGIHFILETHSEYLIRRLQYLTASKEISTSDANIYYFNGDEFINSEEKKVKKININGFGALTDTFGPGFFDEAPTLQFELYKLNQSQSN